MKNSILSIAIFALVGCVRPEAPHLTEPVVQVQPVEVPVVVPCPGLSAVGHPPATPDTSAALRSAPNIAERARLLMAGRALRDGWISNADQAISACSRPN